MGFFNSIKTILRNLFCPVFKQNPQLAKLKDILGYCPNNIEYYKIAFIHKSASFFDKNGSIINNERLEFLGDAVLSSVTADLLFHKFPDQDEGFMTQMRSRIVSGENLNRLAKKIGINSLIVSNMDSSNPKKNIFGDAFEALIGAVYLDKGYKNAMNFIVNNIINHYVDLEELETNDKNFKSQLIEWGQKVKKDVSFYTDLESYNSKIFVSYVKIENQVFGSGNGKSKKEAEQNAAKVTLSKVLE